MDVAPSPMRAFVRAVLVTLTASLVLAACATGALAWIGYVENVPRAFGVLSLLCLPVAFVFGAVANALITGRARQANVPAMEPPPVLRPPVPPGSAEGA